MVELELLERGESAVAPFKELQALLLGRGEAGEPVVVGLGLVQKWTRDEGHRSEREEGSKGNREDVHLRRARALPPRRSAARGAAAPAHRARA
jgi:hypothetical protein